jgi:asparagine synthase (glutamine-hydrolysing)
MCGISLCCLVDKDRAALTIAKMVATLRHRGPDGDGVFLEVLADQRGLALGHNRLSIIDLSDHASQPMRSDDGRYVLIYNGELYNYREMAGQLGEDAPKGVVGDTAVIMAALIKWGPDALRLFNGMWALALFDRVKQELLIARDRFGKKPLYYYQDGPEFYIASEVKTILVAAESRFKINPRVAVPYLTRGLLDFSDETFFDKVQQFPASSFQILSLAQDARIGARTHRYWSHPVELGELPEPGKVTVSEIRELFLDSVRLRMRSDVPVGVLLSGGIDSSSILGAAAATHENVTVLSVVSDDPVLNEERFIDSMARHVGCPVVKLNVSSQPQRLMDALSDACWFNDSPLVAIASLAHIDLMRQASERGIKVLLTGQGADEQLGGYNKFLYFYLLGLMKSGKYATALRTVLQFTRNSATFSEFRLSEAMRYIGRRWLSEGTYLAPDKQHSDSVDIGFHGSYERREWVDLTKTSVPALLHSEDRMSMSKSVEMRVPFLDYRFVELLARVHPSAKFAGGWTKSIFRQAMDGLIPDDIRYRRDKKGFTVPGEEWVRFLLKDELVHMFRSDMLAERLGLVVADKLRAYYERFCNGAGILNGKQFFRAYAFETFLRRFQPFIDA